MMTLAEKLQAMADEYQREPRWLRSAEIGKLFEEWLSEAPDTAMPGPCPSECPTLREVLGPPPRCKLKAGHSGDHTSDTAVRWWER
jgi:hypothetical protein